MSDRKPYRFNRRKDKNNVYYVTFAHIPGRWFSTGASDMPQAVLWAERKLRSDRQKGSSDRRPITLREFASDFFKPSDPQGIRRRDFVQGKKYGASYYQQKQKLLENHILPIHGDYCLISINRDMVEDLVYNRTFVNDGGRLLSSSTRNKIFECYDIVMAEAERQRLIPENPCSKAEKLQAHYEKREFFTSEELRRMFPHDLSALRFVWNDLMWACYFLLQYETGWRPGEVAALEVCNFYPERRGVFTDSDIDWKHRSVQKRIKTSNKGQSFKVGILSERTCALMQLLRAETKGKYFFVLPNGNFIGSDGANKHLEESCRKAGVDIMRNDKRRTQYSLRHSFQSYYLGRMPENARLLLMGHTKTRSEYTHIDAEEVLERLHEVDGVDAAIEKRG